MTIRVTIQNDEPVGLNRPAIGVTIVSKDDPSQVVQPEVVVPPQGAITFFLWHAVLFVAREIDQSVEASPAVLGKPQAPASIAVPAAAPDMIWTPGQDGG